MTLSVRRQLECLAVVSLLVTPFAVASAQRTGSVAIDPDDIGGVVTSSKGPEAGVWVIAETTDLRTKYAKVVVTDDRGRYVIPDLPRASYQVFVRGYGLVDSARVSAKPGAALDLKATVAPDAKSAAQIYPSNYWLALMEDYGDNQGKNVRHCGTACHQVGDKATREIPEGNGQFPSSVAAWDHRVKIGPVGGMMAAGFVRMGDDRFSYAKWSDAIKAGALPKEIPPRPTGIERNAVITLWDWATAVSFLHDEIAAVHYDPKLLPNSKIWGPSNSNDFLAWMDPVEHAEGVIPVPTGDAKVSVKVAMPSSYFGGEEIWPAKGQPRSVALDSRGRIWYASAHRGTLSGFGGGTGRGDSTQPAYCMENSTNKFAQFFPLPRPSGKQVGFYDPKTSKFGMIDTCFITDHNHLREDEKLFFSAGADVVGWIDIKAWDTTQNGEASQGWVPGVVDYNGDGKITKPWTEPLETPDPSKDRRVRLGNGCYQPATSPSDGSIWCSGDTLTRIDLGTNPPETAKAEIYNAPLKGGHGLNIDKNGVVWANYNGRGEGGSAVMTSFDRRKCKVTSGKGMDGDSCAEGWTVYRKRDQKADESDHFYLTYMDTDDVFGIGAKNVPYTGGANSDSLIGLNPTTGNYFQIRVPYPMGFFPRSMQPRIDDAKSGWKGKGLWSNYATYTPWHAEGGKGVRPKVVKFQLRPSPLAK